ncbi:ABC transporter ATP-binding protein [Anaerosporobacter sp.]|uniref:ABC transporter ATP-binding protein n=1 Tax=Anaerosporobacter sp. TaxID=1872529 RepID=UPI00286F4A60|nr:ABC transporter ATP-binding protein [Anaerosporobacter sp.]
MQNNKKTLVEVENLCKYYPVSNSSIAKAKQMVHAVDNVSFQIQEGETLGVVGESGCGKSTIGRQLMALERPSSGRILYDGQDITAMTERKLRGIRTEFQMVFQDTNSSLNPRKQVYDILAEPMLYHKIVTKENVKQEVERLLDMVGLAKNSLHKYAHEFSGGQRQRIGIARALSLKPRLLVCDEPVSALDVSVQAQILNLLVSLQKEMNLTYVFIGHGLGAVRYISTRIAVMYLGKIVEIADAKELFENPLHSYTKALVDASPIPDPNLRERSRIIISGEIPSSVNPPSGCRYHPRCPYAKEECKNVTMELLEVKGTSNHLCACPYSLTENIVGEE